MTSLPGQTQSMYPSTESSSIETARSLMMCGQCCEVGEAEQLPLITTYSSMQTERVVIVHCHCCELYQKALCSWGRGR